MASTMTDAPGQDSRFSTLADYWLGVDLGQSHDYTAISILEKQWGTLGYATKTPPVLYLPNERRPWPEEEHIYNLLHLERVDLNTPYPRIVEIVGARYQELCAQKQRKSSEGYDEVHIGLAVDATGVGRPVVDMLRNKVKRGLSAIVITGGTQVTSENGFLRVPKRDLVGILQVLMQDRRLKIAAGIPEAKTLVSEMQNFKYKLTDSANDTYAAREGAHDDIVLSVAIACWSAYRRKAIRWAA